MSMYSTSTIQQQYPIDTHTHTSTPLEKILPSSRKNTTPCHPSLTPRKRHHNATTSRCGPTRFTSKSSSVNRRFCAVASCRFKAYSAQTRWESTNSASHVCTWWHPVAGTLVGVVSLEPGWGGYGYTGFLVKGGFFVGVVLQTAVPMGFNGWIG